MTLTDFLLARIADDEAVARAAVASLLIGAPPETGEWRYQMDVITGMDGDELVSHVVRDGSHSDEGAWALAAEDPGADSKAHHVARHDPARVLAECAAKRRVVALAAVMESMEYTIENEYGSLVQPSAGVEFDEPVTAGDGDTYPSARLLQHLALPYASHADYDEAWRP